MGSFSIWELLIVLGIVILLFGTKKLRNVGGDLGGAIRSFKQAMNSDDEPEQDKKLDQQSDQGGVTIDQKSEERDKTS